MQTSFKLKTDQCLPFLCQLEFSRLDNRVNTAALLAPTDIMYTHTHRTCQTDAEEKCFIHDFLRPIHDQYYPFTNAK